MTGSTERERNATDADARDEVRCALAERIWLLRRALREVAAWDTGGEGWREEARAALAQDDETAVRQVVP